MAAGINRSRGKITRKVESVGTFAPALGNVLARDKNEANYFNRYSRKTKSSLCREGMKQPDGRNRYEPSGWHKEKACEFQSATVLAKIA
jgi:hypothetical protein